MLTYARFVAMLIWVFLGGAVLRLIKWLSTSVLPPGPVKAAFRWIEEWGVDSICVGLLVAALINIKIIKKKKHTPPCHGKSCSALHRSSCERIAADVCGRMLTYADVC